MSEVMEAMRRELDVESDREVAIKIASHAIADILGYRFYRRLGAPKWAAWSIVVGGSWLMGIDRRLRRVEKATTS